MPRNNKRKGRTQEPKGWERSRKPVGRHEVRVRGKRRSQPDVGRIARAVIDLAMAQAEADAQATKHSAAKATGNTGAPEPGTSSSEAGS